MNSGKDNSTSYTKLQSDMGHPKEQLVVETIPNIPHIQLCDHKGPLGI